jgi:hypothetical protein
MINDSMLRVRRLAPITFAAALCCVLTATAAAAARFEATVVATDGAPLAGVDVTVRPTAGGPPRFAKTGEDGNVVANLPEGRYEVTFEAEAFKTKVYELELRDGREPLLEISLELEAVAEDIVVSHQPIVEGGNVLLDLETFERTDGPKPIASGVREEEGGARLFNFYDIDDSSGSRIVSDRLVAMGYLLNHDTGVDRLYEATDLVGFWREPRGNQLVPFAGTIGIDDPGPGFDQFFQIGDDFTAAPAVGNFDSSFPGVRDEFVARDLLLLVPNLSRHRIDLTFLDARTLTPADALDIGGFLVSERSGGTALSVAYTPDHLDISYTRATAVDSKPPDASGCRQDFTRIETVAKRFTLITPNFFEEARTSEFGFEIGRFGPGCSEIDRYSAALGLGDTTLFAWTSNEDPEKIEIAPFDGTHDYETFELTLNKRFTNNWQLYGSAVYDDASSGVGYLPGPGTVFELREDGFLVNDPASYVYTSSLEEASVATPPAAGVVNVITKSGGNEFSYFYNGFLESENLTSDAGDAARTGAPATTAHTLLRRLAGCVDDDRTFCGFDNRFAVRVDWRTADGTRGTGHARAMTGDSGTFWFFERDNRELLVKTLDGCGINGHYWFFAAGLTNVEVQVFVEDRIAQRGKHYTNPQGRSFAAILDTELAPCNGPSATAAARRSPVVEPAVDAALAWDPESVSLARTRFGNPTGTACGGRAADACLSNDRFRVRVTWRSNGNHPGTGSTLAADTGVFWFFDRANFELMTKALDGCAINGHYWFFAAGLTNLAVTIDVTDTVTGSTRRYTRPAGPPFAPLNDVEAFPCS